MMLPKTIKQQNTQQGGDQRATMRRPSGSQRAQTQASKATEYEEKFLPPCCHKALITTSTKIHAYHQLKGTPFTEMTTLRSFWIKKPEKNQVPQSAVPPKDRRSYNSPPHNGECFVAKQNASKVEDYTSTYNNDFQAQKADMRQPYKAHGNFNVNQGLVVANSASNGHRQKNSVPDAANTPQVQELIPFERITSYRSDYVVHPVQPRFRRDKPVHQTNKGLPPAVSMLAWDRNQDLFDEASEFLQQFKTWSLGTKFYTQGKAKESRPPADHKELTGKTNPTLVNRPKLEQTRVCTPDCTTAKPQSPAEKGALSGFQPISMRTEESRTYWATCGTPNNQLHVV